MPLREKVVIITGAGSGIGQATAASLASQGALLILIGRSLSKLLNTRDICARAGGCALVCAADVATREQMSQAVDLALKEFGRIDGLVNNAGVARFSPIERALIADLDLMIDVHLRGPFNLIQLSLDSLRESHGSIVNVSSIGGTLAMPNRSLYGATKAALSHFTRSLAKELAPRVRVNAVLPGPVDTPIYDDLGLTPTETEDLRRNLIGSTPVQRFGLPSEVAWWICSLLDEQSEWVTGSLITVDGGRSC